MMHTSVSTPDVGCGSARVSDVPIQTELVAPLSVFTFLYLLLKKIILSDTDGTTCTKERERSGAVVEFTIYRCRNLVGHEVPIWVLLPILVIEVPRGLIIFNPGTTKIKQPSRTSTILGPLFAMSTSPTTMELNEKEQSGLAVSRIARCGLRVCFTKF